MLIPEGIILELAGKQTPISRAAFSDPALQLNRGYLERNRAHINDSHEEELRVSISRLAGIAYESILAAQVVSLTAESVELDWVTLSGASRETVRFARAAKTTMELSEQLRLALQVIIC